VKEVILFIGFSHKKEVKMSKVKLIIHERFNGNQTLEDVFLSVFQSESYQLLWEKTLDIIDSTEQSQDSFCSGKELKNGTDD